MIGVNLFRQRSGARIEPRAINQPQRQAEAHSRMTVSRGLRVQHGPGGIPLVSSSLPADLIRTVRTPTAGIPAMSGNTVGSAVCTLYVFDGNNQQTLGTETLTVLNDITVLITGSRKAKVYYSEGAWWFMVLSCS